jgi:hypothetical protein
METMLLPLEASIPIAFIILSLLKIIAMERYQLYSLPILSTVVCHERTVRQQFNLHTTNTVNEEPVSSLFYGRVVQERRRHTDCSYILTV